MLDFPLLRRLGAATSNEKAPFVKIVLRYKLPLPNGRAIRNLMAQPITPHLRGVATK